MYCSYQCSILKMICIQDSTKLHIQINSLLSNAFLLFMVSKICQSHSGKLLKSQCLSHKIKSYLNPFYVIPSPTPFRNCKKKPQCTIEINTIHNVVVCMQNFKFKLLWIWKLFYNFLFSLLKWSIVCKYVNSC